MAKNTEKAVERCKGCGKPLDATSAHTLIEQVGAKEHGPRAKQSWGRMHRACFARMTGKPQDLLEVLAAREAVVLQSTG